MRIENQPAFILHARAYRETSLLLEAFTHEHGRVGLVARGVRRERTRLPRGVLQPLQALNISFVQRGELGTLTTAEAGGLHAPLRGDALFSGLYLNELLLRMTGRNDPHPRLFDAYVECIGALASAHVSSQVIPAEISRAETGWTLRRFERELLAELGYALQLRHVAGSGEAVDADATYAYDPEAGPLTIKVRGDSLRVPGSALLALADDQRPHDADLEHLRRLMRAVIRHHLGGATLNAWSLTAGTSPPRAHPDKPPSS